MDYLNILDCGLPEHFGLLKGGLNLWITQTFWIKTVLRTVEMDCFEL